jgi:hypothetical protein
MPTDVISFGQSHAVAADERIYSGDERKEDQRGEAAQADHATP